MTIGERIKKLRLSHNMTQEQLGELLGVGKATVQKYETNQIQNLKTSHIKTLCSTFDKRPHYFIFDDDVLEFEQIDDEKFIDQICYVYGDTAGRIFEYSIKLNETGRKKAVDYISDLSEIKKYN